MNIADLPLALSLLLPGFVLLHLVFLVSRIRRISAFYATTWSVLISLLLFTIVYKLYTVFVAPPEPNSSWPTLSIALSEPSQIPGGVWIGLYLSAVVLGLVFGHVERLKIPALGLMKVGIDLRKHGDIWDRSFSEQRYTGVRIFLKNGELLAGWPKYYSDDRSDPGPEVYLSPAYTWDFEEANWLSLRDIDGVLIHGSEISRIEFLPEEPERQANAAA